MTIQRRVERLCVSGLDAKALREQALAEIRRAMPFDAYAWLLTDPVSRVGTSPLADVPGMPWSQLPELGRCRYLTRLTRWADLMDAGRHVASLSVETGGDLAQSILWRDVQRGFGVIDVAAVAFWDRFGCWAWLELWRVSPAPVFDDRERQLLESVVRPITEGLRRAQALTFVDASLSVSINGPAVVVLDSGLRVHRRTSGAEEMLLRLNPPDDPIPAIPAAAYHVAAALIAEEAGIPVGPPRSRVHLGSGRWVTLRADRMDDDIAVTIEASTPAERLEVFALAHGLTSREREVLVLLAGGADSRDIAARLVLSDHTVNDHVKAMLAKTGTRTRAALLSRGAGTGR